MTFERLKAAPVTCGEESRRWVGGAAPESCRARLSRRQPCAARQQLSSTRLMPSSRTPAPCLGTRPAAAAAAANGLVAFGLVFARATLCSPRALLSWGTVSLYELPMQKLTVGFAALVAAVPWGLRGVRLLAGPCKLEALPSCAFPSRSSRNHSFHVTVLKNLSRRDEKNDSLIWCLSLRFLPPHKASVSSWLSGTVAIRGRAAVQPPLQALPRMQ